MKTLFEAANVGGIPLKNRLIRSATFTNSGSDGLVTDGMMDIYRALSEGGVGCIVTGMAGVDGRSCIKPSMLRAYDHSFVSGIEALVTAAHGNDCRLVVQLAHCGVKSAFMDDGCDGPVGPSAMTIAPAPAARAMTEEEIGALAGCFANAAERCRAAGADGVELHAAHGYLLSQFLSPYFNHRQDSYGGSIEGRAKALLEVYDAVRAAVGPDYPIWVRLNSTDFLEDGLSQEDFLWVCRALDQRGVNAIEVSGGVGLSGKTSPSRRITDVDSEGPFAPAALAAAEEIKASVICIGGYRTPERMERWLNQGGIEAFSLSRPLICEPALPNRWRSGDRSPAKCIFCSRCFRPKNGFGCQQPQ